MEQQVDADGRQGDPTPTRAFGGLSLRERKRLRTKQMVQVEAMRLFAEKGYEQTTVDDIAHAAAMSPRTFFRYFPSKEDVVLWDEYDDHPVAELLTIKLADEPLAQVVGAIRYMMTDLYSRDPAFHLARVKLGFSVPEIRARFFDRGVEIAGPVFRELADAVGMDPDGVRARVQFGMIFTAAVVAVERWQAGDGRSDVATLFDEAIEALLDCATELKATG